MKTVVAQFLQRIPGSSSAPVPAQRRGPQQWQETPACCWLPPAPSSAPPEAWPTAVQTLPLLLEGRTTFLTAHHIPCEEFACPPLEFLRACLSLGFLLQELPKPRASHSMTRALLADWRRTPLLLSCLPQSGLFLRKWPTALHSLRTGARVYSQKLFPTPSSQPPQPAWPRPASCQSQLPTYLPILHVGWHATRPEQFAYLPQWYPLGYSSP
mmetsp:Transcript_9540/g.34960  ORF Transcript_9540/g.34960 Transcript_9540/m.34960 type:complete len:212 (+) Transcript_9540:974-1609(+)